MSLIFFSLRIGLIMDVILSMLVLTSSHVIAGKYDLICPTETIQAEEGDVGTIQCRLVPSLHLEDYTLDIKRDNEIVHAYRHGKDHTDPQTERYRDRTTLIHEDLSRGIVTLQISSVQLKDSGPYQCFVLGLRAGCTTVLNVVKKVQHNKTRTDDVMTTTSPPNPDAQTVNVGAVVGGVLGAVGVLGFLCALIGVLVKRGTIKVCKKTRGAAAAAAVAVAVAPETVVILRQSEDLHGGAENLLREVKELNCLLDPDRESIQAPG